MFKALAYIRKRLSSKLTFIVPVVLTLAFWGGSLSIHAKAVLAQILVAYAWEKTLELGSHQKPWSWSDTWPVAKLYIPKQRKTLYVLAGGHGSALAFGPGLMTHQEDLTKNTTKIIAGHRDTHFDFLKTVEHGDIILLQESSGDWLYFRINNTIIADIRNGDWKYDAAKSALHLLTCYPFDATISGGPLRFIAIAEPVFSEQVKVSAAHGGDTVHEYQKHLEAHNFSF